MLKVSRILLAMARLNQDRAALRSDLFNPATPMEKKKELFKEYYEDRLIFEDDHWLWTGGLENSFGSSGTYGTVGLLNPHDPQENKTDKEK